MRGLFDSGKYQKLSDLYRGELPGLVKACVPEKLTEEFYYALDQMNQFQMTAGWHARRSVRSAVQLPSIRLSERTAFMGLCPAGILRRCSLAHI